MNHLIVIISTVAVVNTAVLLAVFLYSHFFAKQRLQLVADWRLVLKFMSTWAVLAGASIETAVQVAPGEVLRLWAQLPDDMKALLPVPVARAIPIAILVLALPFQVIRQSRLVQQRQEEANATDHA